MATKSVTIGELVQYRQEAMPNISADMVTALTNLDVFFQGKHIPYIVIGSLGLAMHGINVGRKIEDIDIECICSPETEEIFKKIAEEQGNKFHELKEDREKNKAEHKPYIFYMFGCTINVWCVKEHFSHDGMVFIGGIPTAKITSLIGRKAYYHRAKDLQDLLKISEDLFSLVVGKENLAKFIDKIDISNIEKEILKEDDETNELANNQ